MPPRRVATRTAELRAELESIDGLGVREGLDLSKLTTFRIGGPAELFVDVNREQALCELLAVVDRTEAPFFLLGIGSNVLVPDEGVEGIVAKLGGRLARIAFEGKQVVAGGAASLSKLARETVRRGLVGLEALAGFPSTVGGAVRMNAGSYGTEIKDVLLSARVVDRRGRARGIGVDELGAGYRTTRLQESGEIVTQATFGLQPGDSDAAMKRIKELNRQRWKSLPSGSPNVGSIFRNPAEGAAGKLIDECGLKGLTSGGAQVSPKHGNVIVNTGDASARDVLDLMIEIHRGVAEEYRVALTPEVVLVGPLRRLWEEATAPVRKLLADQKRSARG